MTEGSSLTEFRLDGVIPFPCGLFFEMLTCIEYRRVYDKFTAEIRRIPNVFADAESDVLYWRLKLPLLAERDYVFLRRIVYEPKAHVRAARAGLDARARAREMGGRRGRARARARSAALARSFAAEP